MQMRHLRIMHLFWEHYFLSRCLRYHPLVFLISYKISVLYVYLRIGLSFFFSFFKINKLLIYCHVPLLLMLDFQTISREMLLCLYISFFSFFFLFLISQNLFTGCFHEWHLERIYIYISIM